jgi:hypothetical protein
MPDGAPRFVEQSHGQGAGWLGLPYEPMRINADASKPGYQVADFALHADVPRERTDRRWALLHDLDRQVRTLAATVYHRLGVDPRTKLTERLGRPLDQFNPVASGGRSAV